MRQDAALTRAKLIRAAERLFATRGVDAVSLNEVQREAGQRNKSALKYHFGTKDALLAAILDKHVPGIELRRHVMLDELEAAGRLELRALMMALVEPVFAKLDDPDGGSDYVAIYAQLVSSPSASVLWAGAIRANRGADRLVRLLERVSPELPRAVRMPRYLFVTQLLFHGISAFDRLSSAEASLFPASSRVLYQSHLVDVLASIVATPVSDETRALAGVSPSSPEVTLP